MEIKEILLRFYRKSTKESIYLFEKIKRIKKNLQSIAFALRDLLFLYMPSKMVQRIMGKGDFAFIMHPIDYHDATKKFPFAKYLPRKILEKWGKLQWPLIGSRIRFSSPSSDKIFYGWLLICPLTARQMILNRQLASKRVLQTAKLAEKLGAKIIGLGAFTSIITNDGYDLIGKIKADITTGNTYTVVIALRNIEKAVQKMQKKIEDSVVAIVGAAGSVGSALSQFLVKKAKQLILIDVNKPGLQEIINTICPENNNILSSSEITDIMNADIIIAVTNVPGVIVRSPHIKSGAIVIDAAQPKNVSKNVPKERNDVLVIDSGVAWAPGIIYNIDIGLKNKKEVYGCLGETILLTFYGNKGNYSLGKVKVDQVNDLANKDHLVGFELAPFRNSLGYISDDQIEAIKANIKK